MQHPSKTPHADPFRAFAAQPEAAGLYDPEQEKDACGLAAVATLRGPATHKIVQDALTALRALEHRGAVGADEGTGDGAGIITQVPDALLRATVSFELPAAGEYAVGTAFLPQDEAARAAAQEAIAEAAVVEGLDLLGWRPVPTDESVLGPGSRAVMPVFEQLFLAVPAGEDEFTTWAETTTVYHEGVPGHHLQLAQWAHVARELSTYQTSVGAVSESLLSPSNSVRTTLWMNMTPPSKVCATYLTHFQIHIASSA